MSLTSTVHLVSTTVTVIYRYNDSPQNFTVSSKVAKAMRSYTRDLDKKPIELWKTTDLSERDTEKPLTAPVEINAKITALTETLKGKQNQSQNFQVALETDNITPGDAYVTGGHAGLFLSVAVSSSTVLTSSTTDEKVPVFVVNVNVRDILDSAVQLGSVMMVNNNYVKKALFMVYGVVRPGITHTIRVSVDTTLQNQPDSYDDSFSYTVSAQLFGYDLKGTLRILRDRVERDLSEGEQYQADDDSSSFTFVQHGDA